MDEADEIAVCKMYDIAQKYEAKKQWRRAADEYQIIASNFSQDMVVNHIASQGYYRCFMHVYGVKPAVPGPS